MPSDQRAPEYLSYVTLMILGDDLDPSAISKSLRLRPTQSWKRCEPAGQSSYAAHAWGGWKKFPPESQRSRSLPGQLRFWVRTLRGRANAIAMLSATGHLCALNCYVGSSATASIILPVELQQAVVELGLELRLSFFAHQSGG